MKSTRINCNKGIIFVLIFFFGCFLSAVAQTISTPDGFAAYAGTTGGGDATPITVSDVSSFKSAAGNSTPAVIIVDGRFNVGDFSIGSNKTIIGANPESGLYGGVIKLTGSNYIIQNLIIGPSNSDAMEASGATKIFVTRCSFHDAGDELFSIVRGSDFVTVSWCKFYFNNTHSHAFGHLIGNRTDRTSDRGLLNTTMHHNWYDNGVKGRQPRVRYGHVHIYNNYWASNNTDYGIGVGHESKIRLENSHFVRVNKPWQTMDANPGKIGWDNLIFEDCSQPTVLSNSYPTFELPYSYNMDPVESVKNIVMEGAGNVFGDNNGNKKIKLKSPARGAKFTSNSNVSIEAENTSAEDTIVSLSIYGDTLLATFTEAPYLFEWNNLKNGIYTIWTTATTTTGKALSSETHTIFVGDGVYITKPESNVKLSIPGNISFSAEAWFFENNVAKVEFYDGTNLLKTLTAKPYSFIWEKVPKGNYAVTVKATDDKGNTISSQKTLLIEVAGGPDGYEFCVLQNDEYKTTKLVNMAYGADGKFNYVYTISGEIDCNAEVFGDPIPGVDKACYVQEAPTPYVTIVYPESGNEYTNQDIIKIYAKAWDNDGKIDSVQFYGNDKFLGSAKLFTNAMAYFIWDNPVEGDYNITAKVSDNDGNTDISDKITLKVTGGSSVTDPTTGNITVYPNPASEKLYLDLGNCPGNALFLLRDMNGMKILEQYSTGNKNQLDISNIPSGMYLLSINVTDVIITRKITIK